MDGNFGSRAGDLVVSFDSAINRAHVMSCDHSHLVSHPLHVHKMLIRSSIRLASESSRPPKLIKLTRDSSSHSNRRYSPLRLLCPLDFETY